jgi:hypothetical protein
MPSQKEVEDLLRSVRDLVSQARRASEETCDAIDCLHRAMTEAAAIRQHWSEVWNKPPV